MHMHLQSIRGLQNDPLGGTPLLISAHSYNMIAGKHVYSHTYSCTKAWMRTQLVHPRSTPKRTAPRVQPLRAARLIRSVEGSQITEQVGIVHDMVDHGKYIKHVKSL